MIYGLPDKLRDLREKSGLSQGDVAKRINIAPVNISGYERGERSPSLSTLLSLSYVYNCSVDYLLGKKQEDHSRVTLDITELTQEQRKIVHDMVRVLKKNNNWM